MAKKYGVAILGAGWVAGEYVKAFRDHPLTEVAGVYNRTPGKAGRLMKQHGVEAREYETEDELFEDDRVKIVASCTPPDVRPAQLERAAKSGRHVVIEKPIALDYAGVRRIHKAVTEAKVKSVTSFVLRWNPQFVTVKKLQADGVLGDMIYAEADYWHPLKKEYPSYPWSVAMPLGGSAFIAAGCHAAPSDAGSGYGAGNHTARSARPRANAGGREGLAGAGAGAR